MTVPIPLPIRDEELAFFEKRIRPLLVENCYECHSAESKELAGELLVDSRATIRRGGTIPGRRWCPAMSTTVC